MELSTRKTFLQLKQNQQLHKFLKRTTYGNRITDELFLYVLVFYSDEVEGALRYTK